MHFKSQLMPVETFDLLNNKYNLIDAIAFKAFDFDWNVLRQFFFATRKSKFDPRDRYIIEHQDTDIYLDHMTVGVNLRNFFHIARDIDIPFYTLIFWTNHFGLKQEIDLLCQNRHVLDRPLVIESFCARKHVADVYQDSDISIDSISHHALSMMGHNRSHRFALYHALKNIPTDRLAISIRKVDK